MSDFNAFHQWLGIPPEEQPPHFYRLLGVSLFEKDRAVIVAALDQRQLFLQKKLAGPQGDLAKPLLEQLQQARLCLLNRLTKAQYDKLLRERGVTAPSADSGEPGGGAPINSDAAPLAEPDGGESVGEFQFPDETEFRDVLATSKRMEQRSRRLAWVVNLVVLCGAGGGVWWLMDRGILPPLGTLLQLANHQRQAENSNGPEADEEAAKNNKPPAASKSQAEDRKPPTKSVAAVRRTSKALAAATDTARFARHQTAVGDFSLSADGRFLATGGAEGDCRVWDVTTGETIARFTGHGGQIHAVALSPDGTQVLSSGETLKLWSAATGNELAELITNRRPSRAVLFLSDHQRVATVGAGAVEIWDLVTRKQVHMFSGVHPFCGSLALTADNQTLAGATGAQAEEATLFQATSGKMIRSFAGHQMRISSMALSKDGTSLWTASGEQTARCWDTKTGTAKAVFAHANVVALSPDETLLATGGWNGLVSIWNAQTGSGLMQLPRQKLRILDITFLPDGEHLLIAGDSTDTNGETATIQLWQLPKIDPHGPGSRPNPVPVGSSTPNEAPMNSEPTTSTEPEAVANKLPPPADDQHEPAKKRVREIFQQDFAKALRSPDKVKLAEKLLEHAKTATNDLAGRYVLLQEANDLASSAGELNVATKILDELTTTFDVDALDVRSTTLHRLSTTVKSGPPQERLAEALLQLAEECATASRYDLAVDATKTAALLAIKAKNLKLRETAKNRTDEYLLKKKP